MGRCSEGDMVVGVGEDRVLGVYDEAVIGGHCENRHIPGGESLTPENIGLLCIQGVVVDDDNELAPWNIQSGLGVVEELVEDSFVVNGWGHS